ncbi:MAG: hypothetical protein WCP57_04145 [Bacteroidota bacterium]
MSSNNVYSQLQKIIIRGLLLLSPLIILALVFIIKDPLKVIYTYSSPLEIGVLMNDRHYQAKYLQENKIKYSSFIFGSSRSKMYQTDKWRAFIDDSLIFHMGVNDESIWGVMKKMSYLDKEGYSIKNCLLPLDARLLRDIENNEAHIFRDHPLISGETNIEYYKYFVMAFLSPDFLKAYFKCNQSHQFDESMKTYIWKEKFKYNQQTGDIYYSEYDSLIQYDAASYYKSDVFYKRDTTLIKQKTKAVLTKKSKMYLTAIKAIFDKQHTQYKIIITPNYDQVKLDSSDLHFITTLFGTNNTSDFSGINKWTNDIHNYYEFKHFLPAIADSTLRISYRK